MAYSLDTAARKGKCVLYFPKYVATRRTHTAKYLLTAIKSFTVI